jgi:ribulose-phosphate 3-epimerase
MSIICPTILATNLNEYKKQLAKVEGFAERIQVDLKDNDFAPGVSMPLKDIFWPEPIIADIHIMFRDPQDHLQTIIDLKPNMVIVHAESNCDIPKFAADLRVNGIKTGVCILQATTVDEVAYIFPHVQHLLIFSGDLGHFGGKADLNLLDKVTQAKNVHKYLEIGWDGGINESNVKQLAQNGVDVLNVGGAIQNADNPQHAYATIKANITDM